MTKWMRLVACLGALVLVLAACGSDDKKSDGGDTTSSKPAETTTTTEPEPAQTVTVTPSTGLTDGQTVTVVGKGFTPGSGSIGANECADKGDETGAGDCNLEGLKTGVPDASGTVTIEFVVKKGPFGANNIVCSATEKCLISVSELIAAPTEVGTAEIEFAP